MLIKSLTQEDAKGIKKSKSNLMEVTELIFANEDNLLLTASSNSIINVYNEKNFETVSKLRSLAGGHLGSEIKALAFSGHLSLIASGAANGSITVWDYEMSKIEGVCIFHKKEITVLKFIEPFPCLISSSADGYICIWSIKRDKTERRYSCLCCFLNLQIQSKSAISLSVQTLIPFITNQTLTDLDEVTSLPEKELKQHYIDFLEKERNIQKNKKHVFLNNLKLKTTNLEKENQILVVTGDEKGRIRIWNITPILAYCSIKPAENYSKQNPYFNPRRNENVDATLQAQIIHRKHTNRGTEQNSEPMVIAERSIILKNWVGHAEQITCMSKIEKPLGFVSGSIDRHVKVWSLTGELWGDLKVVGEYPLVTWNFPYDWKESLEKDRLEVINVMKEIEGSNKNLEELQLIEEEPIKVRKKEQEADILPKRSLISPKVAKKATGVIVNEDTDNINNTDFELKLRKKKLKDENPESPLAQDVIKLIELYKQAPKEKRQELQTSMSTLQTRLHKGSQTALKQMLSTTIKVHKKNGILPMIYKKDEKIKFMNPKIVDSPKIIHVKPLSSNTPVSLSSSHCASRFSARPSIDNTSYLALIGVTNNSPVSTTKTQLKNIKYGSKETERTIRRASAILHMKKYSEIVNYNQANNTVLQKLMKLVKEH